MIKLYKLNDITVTIPTLNEEKNIEECIISVKKAGIKKILIIDGCSNDDTLKIIKKHKVKLLSLKKKRGLAYQRMIGVKHTKTKFIALIDADMRPKKNCFKFMLKDLVTSRYVGVEAIIKSFTKKLNYFDKSYQEIMEVNINKKGPRRMIGTPTLWYTKILKQNNFDPFFSGPSDDTDVCYKIFKKGHYFGGSTGICYHVHRSNLNQYFKKYLWYGKGDALFIIKHPERTFSILKHQLFNYPIKFSYLAIKKFRILPIPFMIVSGLLRFFGMIIELVKRIFQFKANIYNT